MSDKLSIVNNKMITEISNSIWLSLNLFRGEISTEDYHFILFLVYKRNNSSINDIIENRTIFENKFKFDNSNQFSFQKNKTPEQLIEYYYFSIINKIPFNKLEEIVNTINTIDEHFFETNFIELFDSLLYKYYNSLGRYSGESLLPKEISRFMINLANLKPNSSIYNPFSGPASLGVVSNIDNHYVGQEINKKDQTIGLLRLIATKSIESKMLFIGDSIANWNPTNEKFDLIVASPPFGTRLPFGISGKWGAIRNFENFTIEKGLDTLNKDGKLIIHVPDSFLFSSGQVANLRYHLIEEDLIESVISFPNGILHNTAIKTSILVINKAKKSKGAINFIIADEFISIGVNRAKILQDLDFFEAISQEKDNDFIKKISIEEVKENDRILESNRYFLEKIEGTKLIDFSRKIRGERINPEGLINIVRIKDLKNDNLNFDLDINSIENSVSNRPVFKIDESCLLLSKIGNTLKPSYFNFNNDYIYITDDIIALKINLDIVDIEYLVNEFYTETIQNQLKAFLSGAAMMRIRETDLFTIKFNIPSIAEQKAKIKGVKEAFIQNKKNELAYQQELLGLRDESFREFASIKHTFRQYLNALKSNVTGTKLFIQKNEANGITLDTIYSKNLNKSFGDHLLGLEGTINSMSKLLSSFETSEGDVFAKEHNLLELVEEAQNRFKNSELFQFEKVYFDESSFAFGEDYRAPLVAIDEDDFYRIFSNIISNAIDHGFKDVSKEFRIRTSITFDEKERMCILEVSNNGKAMPKDFTLKDLTTRGEKTTDSKGSGMGGADIKTILKKYDGKFDISNSETEEFMVTYSISLPLFTVTL
ncbi:MAG: N-6 DNA methylase [Bacteroidia bacterium]|nr:N-6 DNA methylase [Bacteroidia bacterium]